MPPPGTTNAAFNWGVVIGDVVRVVLLFYLMPLWTVLLARLVLGERLTARGGAAHRAWRWPARRSCSGRRRGDAAAGLAALLPLPRSLADWLGLVGGFSFALNNVMLRREAEPARGRPRAGDVRSAARSSPARSRAVADGAAARPAPAAGAGVAVAGAGRRLTLLFLAGNLALQYGAARLPANRTAVVMLTEVVFASALGARPRRRHADARGWRSAARLSSPAPLLAALDARPLTPS